MIFSPLFINSDIQEGLTFAKQTKLKSTNYLFSDIINVFINQEQNNNSFPTLLKGQQTETPKLEINSLLKENNLSTANLSIENIEQIKITISNSQSVSDVNDSEVKTTSLMKIISTLLNNSADTLTEVEKPVPANIASQSITSEKGTLTADTKTILDNLKNDEEIILTLNTDKGIKSFLISAETIKNNSESVLENENTVAISVKEIETNPVELKKIIDNAKIENKELSLIDKNENVVAQAVILSGESTQTQSIFSHTEELPVYALQSAGMFTENKTSTFNTSAEKYFINESINFNSTSVSQTEIKIPIENFNKIEETDLQLVAAKPNTVKGNKVSTDKNNPLLIVLTNEEKNSSVSKEQLNIKMQAVAESETANVQSSLNSGIKVSKESQPVNFIKTTETETVKNEAGKTISPELKITQTEKTSINNADTKAELISSKENVKAEFAENIAKVDPNTKVNFTHESGVVSNSNVIVNKEAKAVIPNTVMNNDVNATAKVNSKNEIEIPIQADKNITKDIDVKTNNVGSTNQVEKPIDVITEKIVNEISKNAEPIKQNFVNETKISSVNQQINPESKKEIANSKSEVKPLIKNTNNNSAVHAVKTSESKETIINVGEKLVQKADDKSAVKDFIKNNLPTENAKVKEAVSQNISSETKYIKNQESSSIEGKNINEKTPVTALKQNEKPEQEPISIKVKRNIKEVNYIKSDSEKVSVKNSVVSEANSKTEIRTEKNTPLLENEIINKPKIDLTTAKKEVKIQQTENKLVNENQTKNDKNIINHNESTVKVNQSEKTAEQVKTNSGVKINHSSKASEKDVVVNSDKTNSAQKLEIIENLKQPQTVVNTEKTAQTEKVNQFEKTVETVKSNFTEKIASAEKTISQEKAVDPLRVSQPELEKETVKKTASENFNQPKVEKINKEAETVKESIQPKDTIKDSQAIEPKEKPVSEIKDADKNIVSEKIKETASTISDKTEPKFEKESTVVKETILKNDSVKNEKLSSSEKEISASINKAENSNSENTSNTSKEDSNKNDFYRTAEGKDIKTELREKPETRFEKELINSRDDTAKRIDAEIKNETVRHNSNLERIVKANEIMKEVAKHIQKQDKNSLVLQLDPENLGKMKMKIEMIENSIRAKIEVESHAIRQHIENNLQDLYTQLSKSGIQLNGVNISLSEPDMKSNKNFSGKKKGSGESIREEEIETAEDLKTKSLGYNTYDYVV